MAGWTVVERTDDGPSLKRDLALATWGLFVGLALLLLAAGLFGTLLGVRSEQIKLPTPVSSPSPGLSAGRIDSSTTRNLRSGQSRRSA